MPNILELLEALFAAVAVALLAMFALERKKRHNFMKLAQNTNEEEAVEDDSEAAEGPEMTILFCSQSGTAQGFSDGLKAEARSYGYHAQVHDIEDYDFTEKLHEENFVVFYIATHGEGEPTDSALDFDEWINSDDREDDCLANVNFAVFGLGNRQYEFYNAMGIKLDKRLEELGANRVHALGLGDDDGSIEEDNENWRVEFWPAVNKFFGVGTDESTTMSVPYFAPSYRIVFDDVDSSKVPTPQEFFSKTQHTQHRMVPVADNYELRSKGENETESTRHVVLDLASVDLTYETAHNLAIRPRNDHKLVAKLCQRLGIQPDRPFVLKQLNSSEPKKSHVPSTCTGREALAWYLDITSPPRKAFLGFLSQYASDEAEKNELTSMALPSGKEQYHEHYVENKMTVLETLEKYPSVCPPLEHFVEECPALQPRYFTISSSAMAEPDKVHMTVAVVRDSLPNNRVHNGVCSTYLSSLRADRDEVCVFVRDSSFTLPKERSTPVIMIGPGTGIAPFRAFVQEATHLLKHEDVHVSNWHLFFGCRYEKKDFLYREELQEGVRNGVLSKLHVAFSRDQEKKVYVQDRLREAQEEVFRLIDEEDAMVFVCGSSEMGRSVRETLKDIVGARKKFDDSLAAEYMKSLSESGRYIAELWG